MNTTKKILIYPTDLLIINPVADYGVLLAKNLNVPALLIDFENVPIIMVPGADMGAVLTSPAQMNIEDVRAQADSRLEAMQKMAQKIYARTNYEVGIGFPEAQLLEKAQEQETILLVIGQTSELNFINKWFGTFETRVAEHADCPVLVLPEDISWTPIKHIFYIMDLEEDNLDRILILSKVAKRLGASIEILAISDDIDEEKNNAFEQKMHDLKQVAQNDDITSHLSNYDRLDETAEKFMKMSQANWLAFQKKDSHFLEQLFSNNQFKKMILQSDFPVFVF
ncbi:MAG: hypothetical protein DHS20C18_12320 [Saprospiraceae bacterium]|nr:MAG: hypothetical protein DHS20C18_12320 [Saprospiraceae bacterium]